ncbi:hypothetical protein EGI31_11415 [Lacihabitans soyangensis]|uniref:Uncharacterized protein n=1 Tax=Lacihabitans soyangensis TaxID=869394 RepID=A0AAE3H3B3_9BACT|nr:hypothetical protein [Lacihabitans soyangensis]
MNLNKPKKVSTFVSDLIIATVSFGMAYEIHSMKTIKFARKYLFSIRYIESELIEKNINSIIWGFIALGLGFLINAYSKFTKNDEIPATIAQITIILSLLWLILCPFIRI